MDSSIYVRKSVGNNIKDLSKYMPEKILKLMEIWIKQSNIEVHAELAEENDIFFLQTFIYCLIYLKFDHSSGSY